MSEEMYTRLREFLDTFPTGYPKTPTGVEIRLLKKLFTPEQAELTMLLPREPEDVPTIAARLGRDEGELAKTLEDMALNGLIFRVRDGEKKLYQAFQFLIGIYEFQLNRLDKEFSAMFEEFLPYFGMSLAQASVTTSQLRVIPVESSLPVKSVVAPYNQVRDLVREQSLISLSPCICAKEQGLLGHPCEKPLEKCLAFGRFAQYYIDNAMGRQIDVDEALAVLDMAEDAGLVLQPTNTQNLEAICCCCSCCCPALRIGKMIARPVDMVTSYYVSAIDPDLCTACGICIERCPMAAIREADGFSEVIDGRCIGCGLCVSTCPEEAITLKAKPGMEAPPPDMDATLKQIEKERLAAP